MAENLHAELGSELSDILLNVLKEFTVTTWQAFALSL